MRSHSNKKILFLIGFIYRYKNLLHEKYDTIDNRIIAITVTIKNRILIFILYAEMRALLYTVCMV